MSAIEKYLKDFRKTIPHHLRQEATAEVHNHLEELTQDWQHRGLARAAAEQRAIQTFGQPCKVGNAWRRVAGVVDWPDILLAALPILGITGLGRYFVGQYVPIMLFLVMFGVGALVAWRQNWPTWWFAWLGWLFLALLVLPGTQWVFFVIFPILVTLLAIDSWQHATLMTVPFTTYLAFKTIIERQQIVTTGWGPGNMYPGNMIWLETAFSILWIVILAASLRSARPSRRGIYLLAGLIGTQLIYIGGVVLTVAIGKMFPAYFITFLSTQSLVLYKLPMGMLTIGLTLYPLFVWLIARWIQRNQTQSGLMA